MFEEGREKIKNVEFPDQVSFLSDHSIPSIISFGLIMLYFRRQRSQSPTFTTTIQFSTSLLSISMSPTKRRRSSPWSCKQAMLLFLCPLGDIFRRRAFVLTLTWFTATMWLGLCLTSSYEAFAALSFTTSVTTVTPQLILPLVGDLAPPEKRAQALSLVVSDNLGGMLVARLLSGTITEYTSWRIVHWVAFTIQ